MIKEFNLLIAGVGAQGVILMSELLGHAAVMDGLNVRGSEILGMAVRGGPVVSIIRMGSDVHGPLIPIGKGDVLIGLEPAEALRNVMYMSKASTIILNTETVIPFTVSSGESKYPDFYEIVAKLNMVSNKIVRINALQTAEEAGNTLTTNIVMLGATFGTGLVPIKPETIKEAIRERFPAKVQPVNLKAFDMGIKAYQMALKGTIPSKPV